jgi:hypothetical protein
MALSPAGPQTEISDITKYCAPRRIFMTAEKSDVDLLIERSGECCDQCEGKISRATAVIDYIVPRYLGGGKVTHDSMKIDDSEHDEDPLGNLRILCEDCNRSKKSTKISARIKQSKFQMITNWRNVNLPSATIADVIRHALDALVDEHYEDERAQAAMYQREEWIKFQAIKRLVEAPILEPDSDYKFELGIGLGNRISLELKNKSK